MIIIDSIQHYKSKGYFYLDISGVERIDSEDSDFVNWYHFEMRFTGDCTNDGKDWHRNDALEPIVIGDTFPIGIPLKTDDCLIVKNKQFIQKCIEEFIPTINDAISKDKLINAQDNLCEYLIMVNETVIILATNDNDGSSSPKWTKSVEKALIAQSYVGKV